MSSIRVQLDVVAALAAELAALAAELDDDARLCRSTAADALHRARRRRGVGGRIRRPACGLP